MGFTIGRLAASANVSVETVRYYQRRDLLPEPPRPQGGVRLYDGLAVQRLRFIRRAQTMGFTLDEISGLLALEGQCACEQTRRLTEQKLAAVRQRLKELRRLEQELVALVTACNGRTSMGTDCPTLSIFQDTPEPAGKSKGARTRFRAAIRD